MIARLIALASLIRLALAACEAPRITLPTSSTVFTTLRPTIEGISPSLPSDANCGYVVLAFTNGNSVTRAYVTNEFFRTDGRFSYPLRQSEALKNGQNTLVASAGFDDPPQTSQPVTFSVDAPPCAPVVVTSPASGGTFQDETPTFTGYLDVKPDNVRCPFVSLTIAGQGSGIDLTGTGDSFMISFAKRLPTGSYNALLRTSNSGENNPAEVNFPFNAANAAACPQPRIDTPVPGNSPAVVGRNYVNIGGVVYPPGSCGYSYVTVTASGSNKPISEGQVYIDPDASQASFSYYVNGLVNGATYTATVITSEDSTFKRQSSPASVTFTVVTDPCPPPVFVAPSPGDEATVNTASPVTTFTISDSRCSVYAFFLPDSGQGYTTVQGQVTYDSSTGKYTVVPSQGLPSGRWQIRANAINAPDEGRSSASAVRRYTVNSPACTNTPVFLDIASGSKIRGGYLLGLLEFPVESGCTDVFFERVSSAPGSTATQEYLDTVDNAQRRRFGSDFTQGESGEYAFRAYTTYRLSTDPALRSPPALLRIIVEPGLCPTPVISFPRTGTYPNTASNRQFTVSGTLDSDYVGECLNLVIRVNGRPVGVRAIPPTAGKRATYTWATSQYTNLPPDTYTIVAYAARDAIRSPDSEAVVYTISETTPSPGAQSPRRKRLLCKPNEELCYFDNARGKVFQECVPDTQTNIESCGGCNGEDCTALPFVDEVACVAGQCLISECMPGYNLVGDRCLPRQQALLTQRRRSSRWEDWV